MDQNRLPKFTDEGLLPEGVHDCSLQVLEQEFGRFQSSDRRCKLMEKLKEYISELRSTGWDAKVIVDGSFVMAKIDKPDDIDLILVLPDSWDMKAEVRPFEYNLISKRMTRRKYGFDVFAVPAQSDAERQWIEFFQQVDVKWLSKFGWPPGLKKGIVRVQP